MERIQCLLEGVCTFPKVTAEYEKEIAKEGERLRANSMSDQGSSGISFDISLPSQLKYIAPGPGVRARAVRGKIVELTFWREPLSRQGVVVYGTASEPLTEVHELKPKWIFGYQKP